MPSGLSLSYVEVTTTGGPLGAGHTARGHMFHHSEIDGTPVVEECYEVTTSRGEHRTEGYHSGGALASYAHLHFASNPELATRIVHACDNFRARAKR
jgi:cobyrinic acid a,c-diamide synthase